MPMTVPTYSAMEQPSGWEYCYLTTWRRMWLKETRYLISKLAHTQVHQMYFRFYRIYSSSSTREILNPEHTNPVQLL